MLNQNWTSVHTGTSIASDTESAVHHSVARITSFSIDFFFSSCAHSFTWAHKYMGSLHKSFFFTACWIFSLFEQSALRAKSFAICSFAHSWYYSILYKLIIWQKNEYVIYTYFDNILENKIEIQILHGMKDFKNSWKMHISFSFNLSTNILKFSNAYFKL